MHTWSLRECRKNDLFDRNSKSWKICPEITLEWDIMSRLRLVRTSLIRHANYDRIIQYFHMLPWKSRAPNSQVKVLASYVLRYIPFNTLSSVYHTNHTQSSTEEQKKFNTYITSAPCVGRPPKSQSKNKRDVTLENKLKFCDFYLEKDLL